MAAFLANVIVHIGVKKWLGPFMSFGFVALVFVDVEGFIDASWRGVMLFGRNVMPVLFPFFFITSLLTVSGFFSGRRNPVLAVWGLSLLGGYPTSSRMLLELVERGEMSRERAIHTATFTSTPGPIFVIATVGTVLFGDTRLGWIILLSTIIGGLLNGLVFFKKHPPIQAAVIQRKVPDSVISVALQSAIASVLSVGGLIVIFFVVGNQLDVLFSLAHIADTVLSGFLEMTAGVFKASNLAIPLTHQFLLAVAFLSFGGLCVGMQGFLFLGKLGMRFRFYLLFKFTHTVLSVLVGMLLIGFV